MIKEDVDFVIRCSFIIMKKMLKNLMMVVMVVMMALK